MERVETSSVPWRGRELPYTIRRNAKRKTVEAIVLPGGAVGLRAPMHLDAKALESFEAQEAPWIAQRLNSVGCPFMPAPREFVTGESVFYLGGNYRLKVLPGERGNVQVWRGAIQVPVREEQPQLVRAALISWFRHMAGVHLPMRVGKWRAAVGVPMSPVVIANQRKRLASRDRDGTIQLNWRLVQARLRVIDYVVVHQLVHLVHRGHGRAYWQALEQVMPDCHFRRENLRQEGPGLWW